MTTAPAQPHLILVKDEPTAPVEGVVLAPTAPVEKVGPAWIETPKAALAQAREHVAVNRGYLPWMVRGYSRYAAAWVDRYQDDWPHMIATARQALREADVNDKKEIKKTVREYRTAYLKHRLKHVGGTSAWTIAAGAGAVAGVASGSLLLDAILALGAWYAGVRNGRPAAESTDRPELADDGIRAVSPFMAGGSTAPSATPEAAQAGENDLITAFIKAGIIEAGERGDTRIVGGIRRDGPGWSARIEFPEGMPAIKATAKAADLAAALRKKGSQIEFKPDTADDAHEGMATLWVGDNPNSFAGAKVYSELINAPSWRFWRDGIPLGMDARQARQILRLIWSSILIGGLQDYGKSYLARLIAAAAALDPTVRIIVITGKKGPDWAPLKKIAHRYIAGSDPDTIREIFDTMTTVIDDMQARGDELDRLFEEEPQRVPEGKITPELADNGMGPVLVIVEELQELLGGAALTKMPVPDDDSERPRLVSAKPLLVDLFARFNRAARFVLGMGVYITQRPDASGVPTELREVCVKRASFRTKSRDSSEMILGDMAVAAGASPHALLESSKGVFVLEEGAEDGYRTLRGDVIDLPQFAEICERGRQLRVAAGALTGDAARRAEREQETKSQRFLITNCLGVMDSLGRDAARAEELATALKCDATALADSLRDAGVIRPERVEIDGRRARGYDRDCLEGALKRL